MSNALKQTFSKFWISIYINQKLEFLQLHHPKLEFLKVIFPVIYLYIYGQWLKIGCIWQIAVDMIIGWFLTSWKYYK